MEVHEAAHEPRERGRGDLRRATPTRPSSSAGRGPRRATRSHAAGIAYASKEEEAARRGDLLQVREIDGAHRGGGSSWQSVARGPGLDRGRCPQRRDRADRRGRGRPDAGERRHPRPRGRGRGGRVLRAPCRHRSGSPSCPERRRSARRRGVRQARRGDAVDAEPGDERAALAVAGEPCAPVGEAAVADLDLVGPRAHDHLEAEVAVVAPPGRRGRDRPRPRSAQGARPERRRPDAAVKVSRSEVSRSSIGPTLARAERGDRAPGASRRGSCARTSRLPRSRPVVTSPSTVKCCWPRAPIGWVRRTRCTAPRRTSGSGAASRRWRPACWSGRPRPRRPAACSRASSGRRSPPPSTCRAARRGRARGPRTPRGARPAAGRPCGAATGHRRCPARRGGRCGCGARARPA